jgi:hypothetical protein
MAELREVAERRGVSIAAVVGDAVDTELNRDERAGRVRLAREVLGAFHSGEARLGRDHDVHLIEAYATDDVAEARESENPSA